MNAERVLVGPMLNIGAGGWRVAQAQGVTREMLADALAGAVWEAAEGLERSRPGRWDGGDLLAALPESASDGSGLFEMMNQSVVAYPEDTVRTAAKRVIEAHGQRATLAALDEVRTATARGEDAGEAWGRLLEVRATAGRPARLSFMDAGEILDAALPPKVYHVFPWLAAGSLSAIVGAGGTGKSRFVLFALACVIAGKRKVGSMEVPWRTDGGRWLVVGGNENDAHRYRADLEELARAFPDALPELRRRLVFHVYRDGDKLLDVDALADVEEKVREMGDADGVVFDPLSDFTPPGESLNDDKTMKALCVRIRDGIKRVAPSACVLLVHHARGGREAAGKAVDVFEAGEAGRNSKMLAATCRCVLNLVPYDEAGGIVAAVGKCNDAKRPEPFAMHKTDAGYLLDLDFDLEAWAEEVAGKKGGGAGRPSKYLPDGAELEACFESTNETVPAGELERRAEAQGISRRSYYRLLDTMKTAGRVEKVGGGYRLTGGRP
ncbi:MAG: AAA family ATPase [Kiritimatiellae bacterium]|nr:AAA family ATPase [Kiritimatiellia bacterium]